MHRFARQNARRLNIDAHALIADNRTLAVDRIAERVDQNLLGGMVVRVGSKMIDSSLRTKLNNLKVVMRGIG